MIGLTRYYVLGTNIDGQPLYGVFIVPEYELLKEAGCEVEWAGYAESEKSAAESWLNQKEFPATIEKNYLTSFD